MSQSGKTGLEGFCRSLREFLDIKDSVFEFSNHWGLFWAYVLGLDVDNSSFHVRDSGRRWFSCGRSATAWLQTQQGIALGSEFSAYTPRSIGRFSSNVKPSSHHGNVFCAYSASDDCKPEDLIKNLNLWGNDLQDSPDSKLRQRVSLLSRIRELTCCT